MMNRNNKKAYIAPEINVTFIELEEGIAAASATVIPGNTTDGQILEEWEVDPDDNRTFDW